MEGTPLVTRINCPPHTAIKVVSRTGHEVTPEEARVITQNCLGMWDRLLPGEELTVFFEDVYPALKVID